MLNIYALYLKDVSPQVSLCFHLLLSGPRPDCVLFQFHLLFLTHELSGGWMLYPPHDLVRWQSESVTASQAGLVELGSFVASQPDLLDFWQNQEVSFFAARG